MPALPGAPQSAGASSLKQAIKQAVAEATMLEQAGFDRVIIENFGDVPFYKDKVSPLTVSSMTVVAHEVRARTKIKLGINVLRNDGFSALAIAAATGAQFVRVNVLSGVAATDQGLIEASAAELMRFRADLSRQGAQVEVWGDVLVKHACTLSTTDLEPALEEVALRAMADAVILTGTTTGRAADPGMLRKAHELGLKTPLVLGSGATPENIGHFAPFIDGVIVGSALRREGRAGSGYALESRRVRAFAKAWLTQSSL